MPLVQCPQEVLELSKIISGKNYIALLKPKSLFLALLWCSVQVAIPVQNNKFFKSL